MKSAVLFARILPCICVLGIASCSDGTSTEQTKPLYDKQVGVLEKNILAKCGTPTLSTTNAVKKMKDELRAPLAAKVPDENTLVKELYYRTENGERIFWLIQTKDGSWIVISDATIPRGWKF